MCKERVDTGGIEPNGKLSGQELFYVDPDGRMMAVQIAKMAHAATPITILQSWHAAETK